MKITVKAEVVHRVSKAGNPYTAIELTFSNGYQKLVFLEQAENFMLESQNS